MPKATYSFRIRGELRDQLSDEAAQQRRSATNMLELILEERYGHGRMVNILGLEVYPDQIGTIADLQELAEKIARHADSLGPV